MRNQPPQQRRGSASLRSTSLERLLPWACIAAALLLAGSELLTMFEFVNSGGEPLDSQGAGERHGNALFVIAAFAIGATLFAVWTGSRPAAIGVATMGGIALLVFLLIDLPDAGQVGTLDDARQSFLNAETVPQAGFWLEMVGALTLAISGVALATLDEDQLTALRPGAKAEVPAPTSLDPSAGTGPAADSGQSAKAEAAEPKATGRTG